MLSPKRASRSERAAAASVAARAHEPTRERTRGLDTWPATVVRGMRSRVSTNPYSRSPCAAWLRFMKSMSIVAQGRAASAWVCRCSSGLRSASSPLIHIFAGEKVCIQVTTPTQLGSSLASPIARRMAAASVSTGFHTTRAGTSAASSSAARSEEHTSELQSRQYLVCRLLLEKKKYRYINYFLTDGIHFYLFLNILK